MPGHHVAAAFVWILQVGSQHRSKAEPAGVITNDKWVEKSDGYLSLTEDPPGPYCRDLTDPPKPPEQQQAAK